MSFDQPNAVAAINQAVAATSEDGNCSDVIGKSLDTPIEKTLPAYDEKLSFGLRPAAKDKRAEIGGVNWGKIEKDVARLNGLAAAIDNIASVVRSGKDRLAHDWKGESFDSFRAAVEKIEQTLADYSIAVKTTANGFTTAVNNIRTLYAAYRDECTGSVLNFSGYVPPDDWYKIGEKEIQFLKWCGHCVAFCDKEDMARSILMGHALQRVNYEWFHDWEGRDHEGDAHTALSFSEEERSKISRKINEFYVATDELKDPVGEAYDVALENLRILADSQVFSALQVPGAAGGGPEAGGDPGPGGGDTGGYPGGGGPGGGEAAMPPQSEPHPQPEPAQVEPAAAPEPAQPKPAEVVSDGETVTIKDGDRSIAVTSPDGEGHVKVTVEGGDGQAKGYDLDFDAASGQPRDDAARPEPGAEHVPAGTNGQCVIKDGPLTITAERPLFDPGTIKLEVDDGVNEPTVYTLDFEETSGDADQPATDKPEDRAPDAPGAKAHAEPATTSPPATADASNGPAADVAPSGQPVPDEAPGSQPADGEQEQVTTPQAVRPDQPAALSGLLVPDQSTGEAELASASDDQAGDQAGSGTGTGAMPMMAGAGAGTSDGGRAGTGWSVHGDLFDNHDPVYSMHGVLGEDDLEGR